eukprot:CAMPEP_0198198596 /NCGR_PEP_ID=MMETSP1445-20131203/2069_1 /TAXON_ID=36898 /ORGANISM="Pyramimonas sp., Strain CCMP2087" /LENGTH=185 /DNA_ID=CAMNT_0043868217 /DNA_START=159 /DNA_END=716 /DNA_ORIENTATION=+
MASSMSIRSVGQLITDRSVRCPQPRTFNTSTSAATSRGPTTRQSVRLAFRSPGQTVVGRRLVCWSQAPEKRSNADLSEGPDALYHELVYAGTLWSDKFAQADYMEEVKKIKIAEGICRIMEEEDCSRAVAETKAIASEQYRDHISRMVEARREANRAKVYYDALKTKAELIRTYEATRRAEMQIL